MVTQLLRQATVTRVTAVGVYCSIATLGPGNEFGPMTTGKFVLTPGDKVLIGQFGNEQESFTVIGPLVSYVAPDVAPTSVIFSFANATARDLGFPIPTEPIFVFLEDVNKLQVWTGTWQQVSWDEARIASIESTNMSQGTSISTNATNITALTTRVTNIEGLTVSDSSTIDFTLSGTWPKDITAFVKTNSIPLNDLSDVVISSPAVKQTLRHDGTNWVNAQLAMADLSTVSGTPVAGDVLRWNGTAWVNAQAPARVVAKDDTSATTTSTTYTATLTGTSTLSLTFVALSTTAKVTVSAFIVNTGASGPFTFYMAPVTTGSGFTTVGPSDADAAIMQTGVNIGSTTEKSSILTGLTVGTTYTVTAQHKVSAQTGNFIYRRIFVDY